MLKKPKLIKDWKGGYVRSLRKISTSSGSMPAGTVYKVASSLRLVSTLEVLVCLHCYFTFKVKLKGKNRFMDFEWLGYNYHKYSVNESGLITSE